MKSFDNVTGTFGPMYVKRKRFYRLVILISNLVLQTEYSSVRISVFSRYKPDGRTGPRTEIVETRITSPNKGTS